jgi:hypothetical protein
MNLSRLSLRSIALLLLSFSFNQEAHSAVGFRQLTAVYPVAVQRGTKAKVIVRSNFTLDGTYVVFFDRPGIKMTYAEDKPIEAPLTGRGTAGTPFHFEVEVPAEQESRIYEFRVATRQAVSSVSHLLVTDFPVVEEKSGDNGRLETAQSVSVPSTVCGLIDKEEDVDCYRFQGKTGQAMTFQIFAQRVTAAIHDMVAKGSYHMDAILTLVGPNGQVIAQNDNYAGGDSLLECRLPTDGTYTLQVRDTRYLGNPRYTYCVEISDRPMIRAVFPLAVQQGTATQAEPLGSGREDTKQVALTAAANEPTGIKTMRFSTPRGETNPVQVLVSEHPQVVAPRDNLSAKTAFPLTLPCGVNGRLVETSESHFFSFTAEKDRYYLFEVEANRFGLPLDAVVQVHDAAGKKLAEADDLMTTQDAKLYFRAPADGQYIVSIQDLHGRGGEDFLYHLRAEPSGPDFEVQGEYYYAMLAPGMHTIWFIKLDRLNGFNGPVEISAEGLPAGVSYTPLTIPAGMNHGALILSAASDAKIDASLAHVFGKAELPGPDGEPRWVTHQGLVNCELQSQGGSQGRWPIQTQLVGVTEPLDLLKVEAEPSEITLPPGGKVELTVKIERSTDYTAPVGLSMSFTYFNAVLGEQLPPGVTLGKASQTRLTGKSLEAKFVLEATEKALPVERLPIAAVAGVSISFSIDTRYASNPIFLTIPASKK